MEIEVTRRGQITIPKSLRDSLNIAAGQQYHLCALEGGILVLIPQSGRATAALRELRAALVEKNVSVDAMQTELRRQRLQSAPEEKE